MKLSYSLPTIAVGHRDADEDGGKVHLEWKAVIEEKTDDYGNVEYRRKLQAEYTKKD